MMSPCSASATCLLLIALVNFANACTDTVYIGTGDGQVAISRDGGNTWSTVLNNDPYAFWTVSANGDHIYASTDNGLYVSHDGGASWTLKNLQITSGCDLVVPSVFVDDENRVYALIGVSGGCACVAVSSDNGNTWPTNFCLPNLQYANAKPQSIYVDGQRIYVASSTGLGYTDDLGATWTFKNQSSGLGSNNVLCVTGKSPTVYAGVDLNGGCVSASRDGGNTWRTVSTTQTAISDVADSMYLQDDTLYVATIGGGVSWSNDFTNWTVKTTADGLATNSIFAIIGSGNNLYLGTDGYGLSISRNKGQTWITKTTKDGLPSNNIFTVFVQCE